MTGAEARADAGNKAVLAESLDAGFPVFASSAEHFVVRDAEDDARRRLLVARPI